MTEAGFLQSASTTLMRSLGPTIPRRVHIVSVFLPHLSQSPQPCFYLLPLTSGLPCCAVRRVPHDKRHLLADLAVYRP